MLRFLLTLVAWLLLGLAAAQGPTLVIEISDGQIQASTRSSAWVATDASTLAWIAIDSPLAKATLSTLTDINGDIVVGTPTPARTASGTTYYDLVGATTLKPGISKTSSPSAPVSSMSSSTITSTSVLSKSSSAVTHAPVSSKSSSSPIPAAPGLAFVTATVSANGQIITAVVPAPTGSLMSPITTTVTVSGKPTVQTFSPTTVPGFGSLHSTLTTYYSQGSSIVPLIVGPSGKVWMTVPANAAFSSVASSIASKASGGALATVGSPVVTTLSAFKSLTRTLSTFFTEGTSTVPIVVAPGGQVSLASAPNAAFTSAVSVIASKVAGGSSTPTITTLPAFSALKTTLSTNIVVNSKTIPLVVGPGGRVSLTVVPNAAFTSAVSSVASKVGAGPPTSTITTLPEFSALKTTLSTNIIANSETIPLVIRPSGRVSLTVVPDASFTSAVSVIASKVVGGSLSPIITTLPIFSLLKTTLTTFFVESGKSVTIVVFPSGKASLTTSPNADFTTAISSIASKVEGGSKPGPTSASKSSSGTASKTSSSSKSSTTSVGPLATITSKYSISLSNFTTSIPGVTGNTVIDTTAGSDHHHTRIPVLFHCFLICPPGGGGLMLWGFPDAPGIYPQFPPWPEPNWPPTITIGSDDVPSYSISGSASATSGSRSSSSKSSSSASSKSSSSSSCSSKTVSDCGVKCTGSAYVQSNKITYSHSCSTTCSKVSGCKVTATTTTPSVSATSIAILTGTNFTDDTPYNPPTTAPPASIASAVQVAFNSIVSSLGIQTSLSSSSSKASSPSKASSTTKESSSKSSSSPSKSTSSIKPTSTSKASSTTKESSSKSSSSSSKSTSSIKPISSSKASSTSKAPASNTLTGTIPTNKWASARPVCNSLTDKTIHLFERDGALEGINAYCSQLKSKKVVLTRDSMTPPLLSSVQKDNIAADGASTIYLVQWSANGCTNLALPPVNFTSMDLAKCVANFLTPIDDCPNLTQPKVTITLPFKRHAPTPLIGIAGRVVPVVETLPAYWKIGGSWYNDCAYWAVIANK